MSLGRAPSHRYSSAARRRGAPARRNPATAALIIVLASVAAAGLYFWFGRNDPLPAWLELPEGFRVLRSIYAPSDESNLSAGAPRYLLRLRSNKDSETALAQLVGSISGVQGEVTAQRAMDRGDLLVRGGWPEWLRSELHPVKDVAAGTVVVVSTPAERLYFYAWSVDGGALVEMVEVSELEPVLAPALR